MSQLNIFKASAGSGKTFRLVLEYLKLLLKDPYNYRHILAVTFTNKATAEMKVRILRDLYRVSTGKDKNMLSILIDETELSEYKIVDNAKLSLSNILHDYDRFAVSTIDSFFQRILRSFARETGLYGTYAVELDQDTVLQEACDLLLMSVEDDLDLRNWLITMSEDQLGEGKNWQIRDKILELGKELQKEDFQNFILLQGGAKEMAKVERIHLNELKRELIISRNSFEKECVRLGTRGKELINGQGLTLTDFKYKSTSFANAFNKMANYKGGELKLGARFSAAIDNPEVWPSSKDKIGEMTQLYEAGLNDLMKEIDGFIENNLTEYNTANEIYKFIYALGVLSTLAVKVREVGQEKNSLLLSEGNLLLKGIIGDNDAPFVYEKTGSFFRYFMIDEFQDTSVTQWDNFKPLVENSLAEGNQNLVVGDVKQSIYRWRNSDWQLLNKQLKVELQQFDISETTLEGNWRSSINVVSFNNHFFDLGRSILQSTFNQALGNKEGDVYDEFRKTIVDAYSDVIQKPTSGLEGGYVQCDFIEKADRAEYEQQTVERMIDSIKKLQDQGVEAGDIAILVKKNRQGKMIAEALLNQKKLSNNYNFEVISDDTLYIESSATVRFLTGLLKYVLLPHDQVIQATVVYEYSTHLLPQLMVDGNAPGRMVPDGQQQLNFNAPRELKHHFISEEVKRDYFPFFGDNSQKNIAQKWANRSLIDLVEELIQLYGLDQLSGEQANLQAFKDVINDYAKRESANLHQFVEWWNQFGGNVKLQTAGQRNAIRIMTIHKSKGLEFPIVMIPFCDWLIEPDSKKSNILWCVTGDKKFNQFPLLPVKYSKKLENSFFAVNYYTEMLLSYIDNMNVLYVAMTRAVSGLYLFTEKIDKKKKEVTISGWLNQTIRSEQDTELWPCEVEDSVYAFGSLTASKKEKGESHEINLSATVHQQKSIGDTLRLRENYRDFLDESSKGQNLKVNEGKLMHELLSEIKSRKDLEKALFKLNREGKIETDQVGKMRDDVSLLLDKSEASSWFDGTYTVLNETTIISPAFGLLRPDRVMVDGQHAVVVDYKTTSKESPLHRQQVKSYANKIEQMGYQKVEGYVWYLKSNNIIEVFNNE